MIRDLSRWPALLVPMVMLVLAGCSKKQAPTAPAAHLPPQVEAVFPAARSDGVLSDTEIWAQFKQPLDSTTVNDRNVSLLIDTRRIPIDVFWDSARRRIEIRPRGSLVLAHTHTVELSPRLATADGTPLGDTYFWQFRVFGVRRPSSPVPTSGAGGESPFAALYWSGTESSAGVISYRLYHGTDSSQVAAQSGTPFQIAGVTRLIPRVRWPLGTVIYWLVTAVNQTSHEEAVGPVWRFETLPAETALDSLNLPCVQWGYYGQGLSPPNPRCFDRLVTGTTSVCAASWPLETLAPDIRLAGASVTLTGVGGGSVGRGAEILPIRDPWPSCEMGFPGPPFVDQSIGPLTSALGTIINSQVQFVFQSDYFASHLEATIRHGGLYGYAFQSSAPITFLPPGPEALKVVFFRTSTGSRPRP